MTTSRRSGETEAYTHGTLQAIVPAGCSVAMEIPATLRRQWLTNFAFRAASFVSV
jgi:hypothetical protein